MKEDKLNNILILDFGSQYTQLIARRIREFGVYCELHRYDVSKSRIEHLNPRGVILSGGPESVHAKETPRAPDWVFELSVPVLGICYGMQTMAQQFGGDVISADKKEFGHARLQINTKNALFGDIAELNVWMSHGDHVNTLPKYFKTIASTQSVPIAAMQHESKPYFGVQFHPEVTHTEQGTKILKHFVNNICGCESNWTLDNIIETHVANIREKVGNDQVLLALSGGVDSSVVAALLHEAIGEQLTCVFVDTGLLRYQEAEQVMSTFAEQQHIRVIQVDAKSYFYEKLTGVTDPEDKRRICGECFIDIFKQESKKLNNIKWLAQGTIYPDVIESACADTGAAHVIKTHHNVGGLPKDLGFELIEPLRDLFKDEVRKLGVKLGLPEKMVYRHPFPGPGLALRILGEIKKEFVEIAQLADKIFIDALRAHHLYDKVSQAFAVFLPIKTVAVKGDARAYDYVIALRAVETVDFMTAHWAELPHGFLAEVSHRICNEVPQVSRVVYDITGKPPATIEWE